MANNYNSDRDASQSELSAKEWNGTKKGDPTLAE